MHSLQCNLVLRYYLDIRIYSFVIVDILYLTWHTVFATAWA
jgi:hypothetical protein